LGVLTALLLALALAACTSEPPPDTASGPDQRVAAFISAWQQKNPDAAADFTSEPAAASVMLGEVTNNLRPDSLTISTGAITRPSQDTATTTATSAGDHGRCDVARSRGGYGGSRHHRATP
jgi:hypothetical protein